MFRADGAATGKKVITAQVGNRQGSWRMLKLVNGKIVSRSQFKEVPMTDLAKMRLEELALIEGNGQLMGSNDDVDYDESENLEYDNLFDGANVIIN